MRLRLRVLQRAAEAGVGGAVRGIRTYVRSPHKSTRPWLERGQRPLVLPSPCSQTHPLALGCQTDLGGLGRGNLGGFGGLGGVPPGFGPGFFAKPPLFVCTPIFLPAMNGRYSTRRGLGSGIRLASPETALTRPVRFHYARSIKPLLRADVGESLSLNAENFASAPLEPRGVRAVHALAGLDRGHARTRARSRTATPVRAVRTPVCVPVPLPQSRPDAEPRAAIPRGKAVPGGYFRRLRSRRHMGLELGLQRPGARA